MTFVRSLYRTGYLVIADIGPEPIDLSDPNAETNLVIRLQFARDQWVNAARRFRRSQIDALAAGRFVGPTPLGYRREGGRLHEHPKLGKVVREAYKRAARDGLHAAVDYLAEKVPGRAWTTDSARKLLASRVYLGESWIWIPRDERDPEGEKVRKVNPDAHKALTDLATWTAAQSTPRQRRTNGHYPLSGIGVCGECGGRMVGQLQNVKGRTYPRYRCGTCARCSISAPALEDYVRDRIGVLLSTGNIPVRFASGFEEAREELERVTGELTAYLTNPALSAMGEAFQAGAEMRQKAVEEAKERYQAAAGQAARSERLPAVHELEDDEAFERAQRAMVESVEVQAGRGPVSGRARIRWVD
jgi:hypothetical protein